MWLHSGFDDGVLVSIVLHIMHKQMKHCIDFRDFHLEKHRELAQPWVIRGVHGMLQIDHESLPDTALRLNRGKKLSRGLVRSSPGTFFPQY